MTNRTHASCWACVAVVVAATLGVAAGAQAQTGNRDNAPQPLQPAAPATMPAQSPAAGAAPSPPAQGQIEAGLGYSDLSDGYNNWVDQYVRGHVTMRPGSTLYGSVARERHFGESGAVGGLTLVQDLSPDWYASIGASSGAATFQNRFRVDAALYRKWGAERRWITGIALMHASSGDGIHHDNMIRASAIYYAPQGFIAEGGVSGNRSNPGSVWSTRVFGAVTMGADKKHWLSLKLDHGQEGYLPVVAGQSFPTNTQFRSTEATVQWRQWVGRDWGYVLGVQLYHNPYYHRAGVSGGLFMDF